MSVSVGNHVWIIVYVKVFKGGQNLVEKHRKKGFIVGMEGDKYMVQYYGPPHHFSMGKKPYGLYKNLYPGSGLESREPDYDDPLEFST